MNLRYYKEGEWHLPMSSDAPDNDKLKIVTARMARKSYQTLGDNPKIDYEADIRLHDRLLVERHASPFEHASICRGGIRDMLTIKVGNHIGIRWVYNK